MTPTLATHRPWHRRLVEDLLERWQQRRRPQSLHGLDGRTLADIGIDASELSSIDSEARGHGLITRRRIVRAAHHV